MSMAGAAVAAGPQAVKVKANMHRTPNNFPDFINSLFFILISFGYGEQENLIRTKKSF
jgi:hypothetical protein